MKNEYRTPKKMRRPEVEVIRFSADDAIVTSGLVGAILSGSASYSENEGMVSGNVGGGYVFE